MVTKFCTASTHICGPSKLDLLNVTLLVSTIFKVAPINTNDDIYFANIAHI